MFSYRDTSISETNSATTRLDRLGTVALWVGFTLFAALVLYIFVFT
jgi:hypothetical protein